MGIQVFTDSTAYIDKAICARLNIRVLPLSVHFPHESFKENEVDQDYFFRKMQMDGVIPTSSQPSQGEVESCFRDSLLQGDDILGVFISSAMSGTYATARAAADQLGREFTASRIKIADSRTNCMALGLQVIAAAEAVQSGGGLQHALQACADVMKKVNFYFVPETLDYLKKGGRIGTASALLGSILKIRPILTVDMEKGMTHLWERARGSAAAIRRILDLLDAEAHSKGLRSLIVHHINAAERGEQLRETLSRKYQMGVELCSIGPVIGLHTGPGTIGIVYCTID